MNYDCFLGFDSYIDIQSSRRSTANHSESIRLCFCFTLNASQFVVCAHWLNHFCQVPFILQQDDQRNIWYEASVLFFTNTNINNLVVVSTSSYLTLFFRKICHMIWPTYRCFRQMAQLHVEVVQWCNRGTCAATTILVISQLPPVLEGWMMSGILPAFVPRCTSLLVFLCPLVRGLSLFLVVRV